MLLNAYFDESERRTGVFSVAGLAFTKLQTKKFCKDWQELFSDYGGFCHMADLHARKRQFKGIDDKEAARLTIGAIKVINNRAAFGSAVACDLTEIDARLPKWIEGFGHAYPFLCHQAMFRLGMLIAQSGCDYEVAYVFESGHEKQSEAHRFLGMANCSTELKAAFKHRSHVFMPKKDSLPLQAADMFAWEYAKYWDDTVRQRNIPIRKSLASILSSGYSTLEFQKRFKIDFLTGPPLWEALEKINALGLQES